MRLLALLAVVAAALVAVDFVSPRVLAQDVAPAAPLDEAVPDEAADDEAVDEAGTLIQIGPEGNVGVDVQVDGLGDRRERRLGRRLSRQQGLVGPPLGEAPLAVSRYWIGIGGGALPPEVRAQLAIPAEEGVLIRSVAPESPAAEAGIELYDVVVRANGEPVSDLVKLAEVVGKQGEATEPVVLDLLRRGQPVQVTVTPIERPVDELAIGPQRRGLFGPEGVFGPEGMLGQEGFPFGQPPLAGAQPGPNAGELLEMLPQMATGVSVSVSRENDGPAKVTVTRGEQTWEFEEGDQDALAALPDDVRPVVERMLAQNGGALPPGFEGFGINAPGVQMQFHGEGLAARMRAIQERMQALQGQLGGGQLGQGRSGVVDPDIIEIEPQDDLDEAPAFNADEPTKAEVEEPVEIEIPAN